MAGTVLLFDPTAPRRQDGPKVQRTLNGLAGKTVGFIDNAKPNFNVLVDDIADLLVSRYGVTRVIKRKKRAASMPAPEDVYKDYTEQCDLVIAGSGD